MAGKCGLVNAANPCRCAKKTRGFMAKGYVNPASLQFSKARWKTIRETAPGRLEDLEEVQDRHHAEVYRGHPLMTVKDEAAFLRRLLDDPRFRQALDLT